MQCVLALGCSPPGGGDTTWMGPQNMKNQVMFPSPLCPKVLKTEGCENAKQGESTSQRGVVGEGWGNPGSLPGSGGLMPPPRPTSGTHLYAARATAVDTMVLRVSFPPKPPPSLFTRTKIRLAGTPNMFATKLCGEKTTQNKTKTLALSASLTYCQSDPEPP